MSEQTVDSEAFMYPREAVVQFREAAYERGYSDGQERAGLVVLAVGHWIGAASKQGLPIELLDTLRAAVLNPGPYLEASA